MTTIQRILCPTDFGECAHGALSQALRLARLFHAHIDLLHVANVPHYVRRDMVGVLGAEGAKPLNEIALEECGRRMDALISELPLDERKLVTSHCRFGAPLGTIMHYAEAHAADLIVMGATGKTRLSKFILGGVAGKTIRHAECPVLCVPHDEARDFARVLVATDFSACSWQALAAGAVLAAKSQAKLSVAHVTSSAWSLPPGLNVGMTGQGTNWLELLQREAREQLDEFVDKARVQGIHVDDKTLLVGSPAQSLLHHAKESAADLIVLGTHGRSPVARLMLGSVAETVVHNAEVPVLTVRGAPERQDSSKESEATP